MITGQEKPDAAPSASATTVKLGYVDQSRDALAATRRVGGDLGGLDQIESGNRARCQRA